MKPPLVAVLKNANLILVREVELPEGSFPDMIELGQNIAGMNRTFQFFRIGITDRKGFYREGTSYRLEAS